MRAECRKETAGEREAGEGETMIAKGVVMDIEWSMAVS
jgi:hypothetical protein